MLSAQTLYDRGVAASSAGRFGAARRYLTLAAERSDEPDLSALVAISLAYVEAETRDPRAAVELCESALARDGISERTRAVAVSQRGLVLARLGDTGGALRDLTDALTVIGDDPVLAGRALLNRGALELHLGDAAAARADFEAAREVLGSPEADPNYDKAGFNLGYVHLLRGELVLALELMDEVSPRLAELGPVYRATIAQDRSEILIAAGLVREGEAELARAARAYGQRGLRQYQAQAELVRARTLVPLEPRTARTVARQAARRFRAGGSDVWAHRSDAVALMAAVADGGSSPGLVAEADALVPVLRRERLFNDAILIELQAIRVQIRRRELTAAAERLGRLRLRPETALATRLLWHEVRGDLARARGRRTQALRHARDGLAELQDWQASFGSLDLQSGLVAHGRQLAVDGLRTALSVGSPGLVFEWSERGRMLVSRVVPVRAPSNPQVAAELTELRWLQGQQPDPRSTAGRRAATLRSQVRQHAWFGGGSGEVTEPCSLGDLQEALGRTTALVAYLVSAERVVALTVTDRATLVNDLGSRAVLDSLLGGLHADLDVSGAELPARFARTARAPLVARLEELAGLLVAPLVDQLADRRVVLTPSGVLAGVPWGLLAGLRGRPVTVARSATSWLAGQERRLRTDSAGFVAGPRVDRAEAEVGAAASCWPRARVLSGSAATTAAVSELAAGVDVLHVSAHGRHSAENPLFSGVELVDGPWFGYDIDQLAGVPEVVLLSACEVGRSQVRSGEELIGMTTAWLHAGAGCVVASAALVNDGVAHDVLIGVHRGLSAGLDPAAALAATLPEPTADSAPAPFVCFV